MFNLSLKQKIHIKCDERLKYIKIQQLQSTIFQ